MSKENSNLKEKSNENYIVLDNTGTGSKIIMPLQMDWQPKEDITIYELSLCMQYLFRHNGVMPCEVDLNDKHLRHFKITNHN